MEKIFQQVSDRITSQVPEIKMTDLDMGQLSVLDQNMRPAVKLPCVLIDISYPRCDDLGGGRQEVEGRILVRLAFLSPSPSDSLASTQRRAKALELLRIIRKVYKSLQGWGTDDFSLLSRTSQVPNNRYPGVKVVDIAFSTTFVDL